jgi:23S rRNA (guanosine2251-2'-O)-methyltransferase
MSGSGGGRDGEEPTAAEWLYGPRVVAEALRGKNRRVEEVWIEEGPASPAIDELAELAEGRGVAVRMVDSATFAGLQLADARRVAARCGPFRYADAGSIPSPTPGGCSLVVVLDHLEDPQNTGAILRTAEAVGCAGVFLPKRRAAQVTAAVVRASAGASEHLTVFRVGNLAQLVGQLQEAGYWIVALAGDGEQRWDEVDYRAHIALVVGSEGRGVQRLVGERCDHRVRLPMLGKVGALNASAAFAAVAYEVVRQQRG